MLERKGTHHALQTARLAATDIKLSNEELAQLDLVSALPPEYPGWMIQRQTADQQRSQVGGVAHHSSAESDRVETAGRHVQA